MAAQTYLSMLCVFKWGIFMFFAGMVGIMTLTVLFFYPETKGLPIEEAPHVFADHWCAHFPVDTCKLRGRQQPWQAHLRSHTGRPSGPGDRRFIQSIPFNGAMGNSGAGSGSGMRRRRPGRKRQRRA